MCGAGIGIRDVSPGFVTWYVCSSFGIGQNACPILDWSIRGAQLTTGIGNAGLEIAHPDWQMPVGVGRLPRVPQ